MKSSYLDSFYKSLVVCLIFLLSCSSQPEKSEASKKDSPQIPSPLEGTKDSTSPEKKPQEAPEVVLENKTSIPTSVDSPKVDSPTQEKPKFETEEIKIVSLAQPPYMPGNSISLKVEGLSKGAPLEGLEFEVKIGDEILKSENNANYTWTPNKPGQFTIAAKEKVSGKEGQISLTVEAPAWKMPVIDRTHVPILSLTEWKSLEGHTDRIFALAISPDGKVVATGGKDTKIKLWSIETAKEIKTMEGHTGCINGLSFSPDGKILASASEDKSIKLWSWQDGTVVKTIEGDAPNAIYYSPDGKLLACETGHLTIKLWRTESWQDMGGTLGFGFDFSPDSKLIAFGDKDERGVFIKFASIEGEKPNRLWDKEFQGHADTIYKLRFSPDGKFLISGDVKNSIKLWSVENNREVKSFPEHTEAVLSLCVSPDGKYFASASKDASIKLWSLETDNERPICSQWLANLETEKMFPARSLAFTPGGEMLVSAGDDALIKIWKLEKIDEQSLPHPEQIKHGEDSQGERYEDKENGFSFEIPQDWAAQKDMSIMGMNLPGVTVIPQALLENPTALMESPTMIVVGIDTVNDNKAIGERLEATLAPLRQTCFEFQEHGRSLFKVGNVEIGWLMYSGKLAGIQPIKSLTFIVQKDANTFCTVVFTGEPDKFPTYQPIVEKIACSVRFE